MELADEIARVIHTYKNVILEGPPGTGKTFVASDVPSAWRRLTGRQMETGLPGKPFTITLHPSTTYEEFVEGLRYDDRRSRFVRRDGFMREVVNVALRNPARDFLVLLDELNRANVPKVFGDLLLSIEASKRATFDASGSLQMESGTAVTLPYSGERFVMPANVFLLGTMNSSDRSIAPLDSALRRRFAFIRVDPLSPEEVMQRLDPPVASVAGSSVSAWGELNSALLLSLGPDALLGHSYLFDLALTSAPDTFWMEVRASSRGGGSATQKDIPTKDWVNPFLQALGSGSDASTLSKTPIVLTASYAGKNYSSVKLEESGSNFRFSALEEEVDGVKTHFPFSEMKDGIILWTVVGHNSVRAEFDEDLARIERLKSSSSWSKKSRNDSRGRWCGYGETAGDALGALNERRVWRYAILPQLIETVTQGYAQELLLADQRSAWLAAKQSTAAQTAEASAHWAKFDAFLTNHLGLEIVEQGHGLARTLAIVPRQAGVQAGSESADGDDTSTGDDALAAAVAPEQPGEGE